MKNDRFRTITVCLIILAVLAIVVALYFGAVILRPVAFAMVLNALFRPIVRFGQNRLRLPAPLCATIVVLAIIAALGGIVFALSLPVKQWVADLPKMLASGGEKIERMRAPIKKVADTLNQVQEAVQGKPEKSPSSKPASQPATTQATTQATAEATPRAPDGKTNQSSKDEDDSLGTGKAATKTVPSAPGPPGIFGFFAVLLEAAEVLLLLLLILAGGGVFLRKLTQALPHSEQRRIADEVVHESESVVLRYVAVTALINVGQGALVGLIMWWLGMPTPWLWALFTFVLEFVPYLGAAVMICLLSIVALVTYESVGQILLVPGSYLLITNLQNNLVSPIAYGSRLKLNPVAVLLGVAFWYFVWGIPGAFLAVPITATMKIAFDRIEGFKAVGAFLGE